MEGTTSSAAAAQTAYALFLHRSELQRRRIHFATVSMTKIQLTDQLIAELKQRMDSCTFEDIEILDRETKFKKDLEKQLKHRQKQLKAIAKQHLLMKCLT